MQYNFYAILKSSDKIKPKVCKLLKFDWKKKFFLKLKKEKFQG